MNNFYARIAGAASRFPDRVALEWIGRDAVQATTYAALIDESSRVAGWLSGQAGVVAGDRVAMLAANDTRWVAAYLAVLHLGAVVVPLDTAYSADQVHTILADSGAVVLFTTPRYLDTAAEAASRLGAAGPRVALLSGASPAIPGPEDLAATPASTPPAEVDAHHAAVILYTSGTTADPKGVVLTHANLDAERAAVLTVVEADERDVVLGVLPLFHALAEMANLWLPLTIGARIVFLETVSATTLLDALRTRGVTILACVPQFFYLIHQRVTGEFARRGALLGTVLRALMGVNVLLRDHLGWNPGRRIFARVHQALGPRMRLLITGGSRFDPAIARDLYGLGVSLYNGYGLTETSGAAAIVHRGDRFTTSVGPPLPGVEIRIGSRAEGVAYGVADLPPSREATADRQSLGVGGQVGQDRDDRADGEILIRGPIVMREYWQRPDATAAVIRDGWLHTGDLGRIDAEGRLYITGRLKEIIVLSSGKNLYPEEIEAHYGQSVFIKEVAVLGLSRPGDPAAERLHAVAVPDEQVMRERGIVNYRELIRFEIEGLSVQLPAHKRILSYDLSLEPLPRTTTGKLRRGEIERQARHRASTPASERAATAPERAWLAEGDHARAIETIAADLGVGTVHPDANLELDLGLDSMERVELITGVEGRAGRRVPPEVRATIFTVRQLVDAVERAPGVAASAPDERGGAPRPWATLLAEPPDPALVRELARPKFVRSFIIYVIIRIVLAVARVTPGLSVTGRANIPARAPFMVCPNHQTLLDGFLVAGALPFHAFRQIFFVGAAEFFETRFMAWGARAINIIPVDPDANLVNAMRAAATGLSQGKMLMLFPEGERTIDGEIKPFRKGAAILASHLDVPIVPVAIDGLFPLWPRGRPFRWSALLSWNRSRVTIAFGAPIRVPAGAHAEGTDTLQRAVVRAMDAIRRG